MADQIKLGITGFGRIGRLVLRAIFERPENANVDITAINATVEPDYMAYMLKYDTLHPGFGANHRVEHTDKSIIIDGHEIKWYSDRDATKVPWADFGAEVLVDATGVFKKRSQAEQHLQAGVKKVVLTSPSDDCPMFVAGVNFDRYTPDMDIVSNASCTTNCLAPLAKVVNDKWGIESGLMTTIHSVTASQKTVDGKSQKDWRGGRAASYNIIPSTTGAAKAVGKVIPELAGKLTGASMRVPTLNVSVVDLTANLKTAAAYEELCAEMKRASENELAGILGYTEDAVVSSDFIHDHRTSIFDAKAGIALTDRFVKLVSWYDNEWGYSCKVLDLVRHIAG
ncbi:MAG: type I glyceraldehyde-3-phosphate dehydrogenase [Oscillospiraceae bacterium]|jgi:glyceraldehyde 3-phosphate dehydrogenase|nr:type I glyceraldehyde-3-phosphate dehydrogenase [Oscillospiraceae bacterium]